MMDTRDTPYLRAVVNRSGDCFARDDRAPPDPLSTRVIDAWILTRYSARDIVREVANGKIEKFDRMLWEDRCAPLLSDDFTHHRIRWEMPIPDVPGWRVAGTVDHLALYDWGVVGCTERSGFWNSGPKIEFERRHLALNLCAMHALAKEKGAIFAPNPDWAARMHRDAKVLGFDRWREEDASFEWPAGRRVGGLVLRIAPGVKGAEFAQGWSLTPEEVDYLPKFYMEKVRSLARSLQDGIPTWAEDFTRSNPHDDTSMGAAIEEILNPSGDLIKALLVNRDAREDRKQFRLARAAARRTIQWCYRTGELKDGVHDLRKYGLGFIRVAEPRRGELMPQIRFMSSRITPEEDEDR